MSPQSTSHPLDPLSATELEAASKLIRSHVEKDTKLWFKVRQINRATSSTGSPCPSLPLPSLFPASRSSALRCITQADSLWVSATVCVPARAIQEGARAVPAGRANVVAHLRARPDRRRPCRPQDVLWHVLRRIQGLALVVLRPFDSDARGRRARRDRRRGDARVRGSPPQKPGVPGCHRRPQAPRRKHRCGRPLDLCVYLFCLLRQLESVTG